MSSIFHGQGIVFCEGLVRGGSESPIPDDPQPLTSSQHVIVMLFLLVPAGLLFEMSSIFHGQGIVNCEGLVRGGSESFIPHDTLP
jgi:hypothetical protein